MSYSIKDLKILSPVEHVRSRQGVYIGDPDSPAPLFNEIMDNALDEAQAGYSQLTTVIADYDTNTYTVEDSGRGFPQGKLTDPTSGKKLEAVELLATTAFSGGKFSHINYKLSSGLNGLGLMVTNALSKTITVETWRTKESSSSLVKYEGVSGKTVKCQKSLTKTSSKAGTRVSFVPDSQFFKEEKIPKSHIITRCKIAEAFGMPCQLTFIEDGKEELVTTKSTVYDLFPEDDTSVMEYYKTSFSVKDEKTGEFATVALKYTSDTKAYYRGYTNLLYNSNGGTHHKMLESAIQEAWAKFKPDNIKASDVLVGVRGVIAVFISDTEFSSQSKERLSVDKKKLEPLRSLIVKEIYKWLKSNDELRESLIKRFQEYRASQDKLLARKEIKSLLVVNTSKGSLIHRGANIRKLRECESKERKGTELFICEGDSALGSAVQARDPKTQAVIPVRGKILNIARCSDIKEALTNEETRDIVNAIGAGIGEESDPSKSRYDKIIFLADADADGKEINVLLSGLFINLLPNLVKAGMVYITQPPLYGWTDKKGKKSIRMFADTLSDIPKDVLASSEITRYKGVGQLDPDELWEAVMNPSNRKLLRLQYPDDITVFNSILTSSSVKFKMLEEEGVIRYES